MAISKKRQNPTSPAGAAKIYFDRELRELWVNGNPAKSLDARATSQIQILSAFQEENWPRRIDDPLRPKDGADGKARLRSTIHSLNGCQHPWLIRFFADGTGHGIRWELIAEPRMRSSHAQDRRRRGRQRIVME